MARVITFKVGIPIKSVRLDPDEVNESMKKGLEWWQGTGPKDICPFISVPGRCRDLCGRLFLDADNVYKECPFKQTYSEVELTALVQKLIEEISK